MLVRLSAFAASLLTFFPCTASFGEEKKPPIIVETARESVCQQSAHSCGGGHAVVFVHGIYGGKETFVNEATGMDWPKTFPALSPHGYIDTYRLEYLSKMVSWAKKDNPDVNELVGHIFDALKPLRKRDYKTINFIAHSLGGNLISHYILFVKARLGHAAVSQHGFVITLGTPALGSQWANVAAWAKNVLFMSDPLLDSLKKGNLFLATVRHLIDKTVDKGSMYACRPLLKFAAFEAKSILGISVVRATSEIAKLKKYLDSPPKIFNVNHIQIAKPKGVHSPVFLWTSNVALSAFSELDRWDRDALVEWGDVGSRYRLCRDVPLLPE